MVRAGSQWRVRLFGVLDLHHGSTVVPPPPSAAARGLLSFLVLHRNRPQARAALIDRFWPDLEPARGRRAITQALWHLRSTLPDVVEADDHAVGLAGPDLLWSDVSRFDVLTAPLLRFDHGRVSLEGDDPAGGTFVAALDEAIALYRGELLEGEHADWLLPEREQRRERFLLALARLAAVDRAAGRLEAARERLQRLLHLDPLREEAQRELMRIFAAMDRPADALRQFEACRGQLEAELGQDPASETTALALEIARRGGLEVPAFVPLPARPSGDGPGFGALPLLGRAPERSRLVGHVEAMIDGQGGLVLLEGEPGVGKTRLLAEVARDAAWRGADVLTAQAGVGSDGAFGLLRSAMESAATPLKITQLAAWVEPVWLQVLAPFLPVVAEQLPELGDAPSMGGTHAGRRLQQAFSEVLLAWSRIQPVVLQLEDLHACDPDSLAALNELHRRISDARLLIMASYRGAEARAQPALWAVLRAIDRLGVRDRLNLDRLSAEVTSAVLETALGAPVTPSLADACWAACAGNPLYLRQLLRGWREEGWLLRSGDGSWRLAEEGDGEEGAPQPLPEALEAVIEARLDRLPESARRVLEVAAVLGSRVCHPELEAVAGLEARELLDALRSVQSHGMLIERPQGYRFDHDLLREVAILAMSRSRFLGLHAAAAAALILRDPADHARLCGHYAKAEDWPAAVEHGLAWAETAHAQAANESAWLAVTQVLDWLEQHAPWRGQPGRERMARALTLRRRLAWMRGDREAADADAVAIAGLLDQWEDDPWPLDLTRSLFHHEVTVRKDFESARRWLAASLERVEREGNALQQVQVRRDEAMLLRYADRFDEARALLEETLRLLDSIPDLEPKVRLEQQGRLLGELSISCRRGGMLEDAAEFARRAVESAEDVEHPELLVYALSCRYVAVYRQGRLAQAAEVARRGAAAALRVGNTHNVAVFEGHRSMIAWSLRDYGEAIEASLASRALYASIDDRLGVAIASYGLGNLYLDTGQWMAAEGHLLGALDGYRAVGQRLSEARILSTIADMHVLRGQADAARERIEQGIAVARAIESEGAMADLENARGRLLLFEGQVTLARDCFSSVLEHFQEQGLLSHLPAVRAWLALALSDCGAGEDALVEARSAWQMLMADEGPEDVECALCNLTSIMRRWGPEAEADAWLETAHARIQTYAATLEERERTVYLEQVPAVRALREAWQAGRPTRLEVRLPRIAAAPRSGASVGPRVKGDAALRSADASTVLVTWTVAASQDEAIAGGVARRRHRLRRLLAEAAAQGAEAGSAALAEALDVSRRTIERDLAALAGNIDGAAE